MNVQLSNDCLNFDDKNYRTMNEVRPKRGQIVAVNDRNKKSHQTVIIH